VFILQVIDKYCRNCLFAENAFKVSDELCGVVESIWLLGVECYLEIHT